MRKSDSDATEEHPARQLLHLLIADDHAQTVHACRTALEGSFDITIAGTLDEAARVAAEVPLSLILLDPGLGDGSVADFCAQVRGGPGRRPAAVLLLGPPRFSEHTLRTLRPLCDGCLFKPFHIGELRAHAEALVAAGDVDAEAALREYRPLLDTREGEIVAETARPLGDRVGSEIAGCKIERVLGRGASGTVYLARHLVLDVPVALKLMALPAERWGAEEVERFLRGARAAARVQHPNVVPILNAGEEGGFCFLVQRYIEGEALKAKIESQGRMDEEVVIRVLREIASGLGAVHRLGTVHRDVKPGNIIITSTGRSILTDFGLARLIGRGEVSSTDYLIGTPYYMAPEQCEGIPLDGRAAHRPARSRRICPCAPGGDRATTLSRRVPGHHEAARQEARRTLSDGRGIGRGPGTTQARRREPDLISRSVRPSAQRNTKPRRMIGGTFTAQLSSA